MFGPSPSKQELQAQMNSSNFQRAYNNFSPINGGNVHSSTQQDFNVGRDLEQSLGAGAMPARAEKITLPFKRDYEIIFHEHDVFKISLVAQMDSLTLLLVSTTEVKMWKGEYQAEYLEDISRKTGREMAFKEFVELINQALTSQDSNKLQASRNKQQQIFIDLLGYQDLQLLKARRGPGAKVASMQSQQKDLDPVKSKKRYIILTHLEKYNVDNADASMNSIKEEIEAENGKTHYPLPLNMLEITDLGSIKKQGVPKTMMRQIIRFMGDAISQSQGTMQTQSSGFGMSSSILNKTIKSDMKSEFSARRTAREFFSKDNESHPSIEENKILKDQLSHLKEVKKQTMSFSGETAESAQQQALEVRLQLDSYKQFVKAERERLLGQKDDIESQIARSQTELSYKFNSTGGSFTSHETENIEDIRRKLATTSIELEEERERYKRQLAKKQKDIEMDGSQLDQLRAEDKKMRFKINQIENDLMHQIKRLDIVCKSKGLPRPNKDILKTLGGGSATRAGNTYVSPYGRNRASPAGTVAGRTNSNQRPGQTNLSNNSRGRFNQMYNPNTGVIDAQNRQYSHGRGSNGSQNNRSGVRPSRFYNNNYTPPGQRGYQSPAGGANAQKPGSNGRLGSGQARRQPDATMTSQNRVRNPVDRRSVGRSPSMASDNSKKSIRSSGYGQQSQSKFNRLYSPNGTMRQPPGYQSNSGVNRVRRNEGAVQGSFNANNPSASGSKTNLRGSQGMGSMLNRKNSKASLGSHGGRSYGRGGQSDRSRSDKSDTSARRVEPHKALMSAAKHSKFVMNTRTINRPERAPMMNSSGLAGARQAATESDQNIDDKISKLQSLLKMAKGS